MTDADAFKFRNNNGHIHLLKLHWNVSTIKSRHYYVCVSYNHVSKTNAVVLKWMNEATQEGGILYEIISEYD